MAFFVKVRVYYINTNFPDKPSFDNGFHINGHAQIVHEVQMLRRLHNFNGFDLEVYESLTS